MIPSMYAKLFSRIAQSSLMEEDVEVRYCFMMLLAIADSTGDVIGTDIALARTVNLPLDTFRRCIAELMEPDPDSNSQVVEGRRIVLSENGRGYRVVNYVTYRQIKTNDEKRAYMREYMQRRRKGLKANDVTPCKTLLSDVTHSEAEGESEGEADTTLPPSPPQAAKRTRKVVPRLECPAFREFWTAYPNKKAIANAEAAWVKHDCAGMVPQILATIRKLKTSPQWVKDGGSFIPHPATWLNARGWEDELLPVITQPRVKATV
jgi:hypothetical protein